MKVLTSYGYLTSDGRLHTVYFTAHCMIPYWPSLIFRLALLEKPPNFGCDKKLKWVAEP